MNASLIASIVAGVMITGGLTLAVYGIVPHEAPPPRPSRRFRPPAWITRMPRWQRLAAVVALAVGVIAAAVTGWVVLAALLPLAVVGLPAMLASSDAASRIARVEAISEWTRNLSGVLTAGQGLEQALQASLRATPDAIRPEVSQLVGRLRARWSTETALRAFGDDLDDLTGDLAVAALILGSHKRGDGLARVLTGLAESVAEEVKARRQIEADRAKPRSTARTIMVISLVALVGLGLSGQFLVPYGTPLGQVLLAVYLAGYAGCAVWIKRLTAEPPSPRFLARRSVVSR